MRFYPEALPPFEHEPTRDRFEIREISENSGQGIVALVDFAPGDIVFRFTGFVLGEQTLFSLQAEPGLYVHDPFFMGKTLHSCDPNCDVDMTTRTFRARRAIRVGDIVTMDYEQTEDVLWRPFQCGCGAAACRGWIRGRKAHNGHALACVGASPAEALVPELAAGEITVPELAGMP